MELGTYMAIEGHQYVPKILFNEQRFHHTHVIGKTGMGKSTALKNWAIEDMDAGDGLAFFDLHGHDIDDLLAYIPAHRHRDVVLFDISDREHPIGFNPLFSVAEEDRAFAAEAIVDSFRSIWHYSWGPQLEEYLRYGTRALLDADSTLLGLKYLLTKPQYRESIIRQVQDPVVKDFWRHDFEALMTSRDKQDKTQSLRNKLGVFLSDPLLRNLLGQTRPAFHIDTALSEGRIVLFKLPQGTLGLEKARILALLLISSIHLAALKRPTDARPFHLFIDEAHHLQSNTLMEMLSGIRKFNVSLTLAHQYLDQLDLPTKSALLGTAGTLVAYQPGVDDTKTLISYYGDLLDNNNLLLGRGYAQIFNGNTYHVRLPNSPSVETSKAYKLINRCRNDFSIPRTIVENKINKFIRSLK